jgi:predicted peptidase
MRTFLGFVFLSLSILAAAQDFDEYKKEIFKISGAQLPYRILYPLNFDPTKTYPLLIFLHGAYNKGGDNEGQLAIGGRYFLREENRRNFPAVIIFPQCPEDDSWAYFETEADSATGMVKSWRFPFKNQPTRVTALLKKLVDSLLTTSFINQRKIYIGGLSQGGMGVYDMIARYPHIFAGAFPICGAGKVSTADRFAKEVAVWIFHGEQDDVVPVSFSRQYYKRLQKLGADVKYSEYQAVKHNSWTIALAEKELMTWLFSKSKK